MDRIRTRYPNLFKDGEVEESKKEETKIADDDFTQVRTQPTTTKAPVPSTEEVSKVNKRVRDMYGNFIVAGNYINYPGRKGSDTYVRTAKVLAVTERNLDGDRTEPVLKIAVAMAPRWPERKNNPDWETKIVKTTMTAFCRACVIPQSYIQNDDRYKCLLEV